MLVESLVLDRDLSFLHISGNVLVVYPDTVFGAVKLALLNKFSRLFILYKDTARLVHRLRLEVDTRRLVSQREDVDRKRYSRDDARDQ